MIIRAIAALVLALIPAVHSVEPASACSCLFPDEESVRESSIAFTGRWLAAADYDGNLVAETDLGQMRNHVFEVESMVKGRPTQLVVVHGGMNGSCSMRRTVLDGEEVGIMTHWGRHGQQDVTSCSVTGSDNLLKLAASAGFEPREPAGAGQITETEIRQALSSAVLPPEPPPRSFGLPHIERKLTGAAIAGGVLLLLLARWRWQKRSVRIT